MNKNCNFNDPYLLVISSGTLISHYKLFYLGKVGFAILYLSSQTLQTGHKLRFYIIYLFFQETGRSGGGESFIPGILLCTRKGPKFEKAKNLNNFYTKHVKLKMHNLCCMLCFFHIPDFFQDLKTSIIFYLCRWGNASCLCLHSHYT